MTALGKMRVLDFAMAGPYFCLEMKYLRYLKVHVHIMIKLWCFPTTADLFMDLLLFWYCHLFAHTAAPIKEKSISIVESEVSSAAMAPKKSVPKDDSDVEYIPGPTKKAISIPAPWCKPCLVA